MQSAHPHLARNRPLSFLRAIAATLALSLLLASCIAHAASPASLRNQRNQRNQRPAEATLTKPNLDQIKRFILKRGQTCTYHNMFNNHPCFSTGHFTFYLHPDPGPNNQLQWNINCDPALGDFNTLVVRQDRQAGADYRIIRFKDAHKVALEVDYKERSVGPKMLKASIRELPAQAVEELLKVIEQGDTPENGP